MNRRRTPKSSPEVAPSWHAVPNANTSPASTVAARAVILMAVKLRAWFARESNGRRFALRSSLLVQNDVVGLLVRQAEQIGQDAGDTARGNALGQEAGGEGV